MHGGGFAGPSHFVISGGVYELFKNQLATVRLGHDGTVRLGHAIAVRLGHG